MQPLTLLSTLLALSVTTVSGLALPQFGSSGSSTADDVKNNVGCRPLTVIFARGTSERGNIGSVVGPPLRTQLQVCNTPLYALPIPLSTLLFTTYVMACWRVG